MEHYFLGIDQGTTGTTALLIDERWQVAARVNVEHTQIYPRPGWVEHDPTEIWEAVLQAVDGVLKARGVRGEQLLSIGLDNQGETCMVWNRKTGQPVYNAIVWQDRRTAGEAERLKEAYGGLFARKTGLTPDAYFSATKLRWILDNVPGVREEIRKGNILAGTLDSWLTWKLTGGRAFVTDPSTASRTMLCSIETLDWDPELLALCGVPREILPPVRDTAELYGYTDPDVFFGARVPVAASITDSPAALLAQGCLAPGETKTTYGTGCFMYSSLGDRILRSEEGLLTSPTWRVAGKTGYALDGGIYIAGAAVQWLRDKLRLVSSSAETEAMARAVPDTGNVYFVPAFSGLASPHWDPYARGMIIGITGGTSAEHIVRATLESIAFQVCDTAKAMERSTGNPFARMRVDGGPTANGLLMQFQADLLGVPVEVPQNPEMTGCGAAFLAALAMGHFQSLEDIRPRWALGRRYEPQMSEDQRQYRLHQWHRAVERCKSWEKP